MSQAAPHTAPTESRLVRLLAGLAVAPPGVSHKHFAERLGQLFDLPDSIALATAHSKLGRTPFAPASGSRQGIKDEFLGARSTILAAVLKRFAPATGPVRLRFPTPEAVDSALAPEPYLEFYTAQQRDIEFRVRTLHERMREALAGLSPELARLAALDAALGQPIAVQARRGFAVVPKLLRRRVEHLLGQYQQACAGRGHDPALWQQTLQQLRDDVQGLLLAEIDARLLPVLGLVEAIDEDKD